jgi:hypothetical protein
MPYDNTNRGTIAKNTRKTEDNHPDIAGQINVNGVDFWLNGWAKKNSKDGSSFYSLTVKEKEAKAAPQKSSGNRDDPRTMRGAPDEEDTIPF